MCYTTHAVYIVARVAIMKFLSGLLLLITPLSLALPTAVESPVERDEVSERACYVTCGSHCYTSSQVTAARNAGYNYVKQGGTAGGSTYPHVYNNYEGFDFLVSGTVGNFGCKAMLGSFTKWWILSTMSFPCSPAAHILAVRSENEARC